MESGFLSEREPEAEAVDVAGLGRGSVGGQEVDEEVHPHGHQYGEFDAYREAQLEGREVAHFLAVALEVVVTVEPRGFESLAELQHRGEADVDIADVVLCYVVFHRVAHLDGDAEEVVPKNLVLPVVGRGGGELQVVVGGLHVVG